MKLYRTYIALICLLFTAIIAFGQANINRMEYFIDTDPGIGNGIAVPVTFASNITETLTVPTSALPAGFHTIYFRVQDDNNEWSISESRSFYVSESNLTIQAQVQAMEYFIDTDPGIGTGTPIPIASATDILINQTIPTSALPAGFHVLYIRSRDSDGIWGNVESRSFYVSQNNLLSQADIVSMEYFFDTDPGVGSANPIPVTAGTSINESVTIPTAALNNGNHTLYIRALDSDGIWSILESRSFLIDAFSIGRISGIEYFYNSDPGIGNATQLNFAAPVDSLDSVVNLSTAALPPGPQVLGIRLVGETGVFSMTEFANVTICDGATASIQADTVCLGSATTILDLSTNVLAGDVFSWDFDTDGTEDDNTAGDKSIIYPAPGNYRAALTIDRLGCLATDTIDIVVVDQPVAMAGIDQTICSDNLTMAATPSNALETGTWSIFSGAGLIADVNDPLTNVTNITSQDLELIWTVTSEVASCGESDTVMITANLPITASNVRETVDIGQSVIADVQSAAQINPGDILTTEITTIPLYGLSTILADGTIEYTPDLDAPALDSLLYRVTNQCSNFAEEYLVYTIVNAPPVVDNTNSNPVITTTEATLDLTTIISDPNNNIDFTTIEIVSQPISGAEATVDNNGVLTINYQGITFSGTDQVEVRVCDLVGVCTVQIVTIPGIDVGGDNPPVFVFNAVSPNGDGFNDFLEIENIEFYPDNTVLIVNRWGKKIEELKGYNNVDVVFNDPNLPSGTYYYHILLGVPNTEPVTGHFILKTDN